MKPILTQRQQPQSITNNDLSRQSQYDVQITINSINSRKSSITLKTNKTVDIRIDDQAKKKFTKVVSQQKHQQIELKDSQNVLLTEHTTQNNNSQHKFFENRPKKLTSQHNSIIKTILTNQQQRTKTNVSINNKDEGFKNQTMNVGDDLQTPGGSKSKKFQDFFTNITKQKVINIENPEIQELQQKLNEKDIQLKEIKQDLTKCKNAFQLEKEQKQKIQEQFSKCQQDLQKEKELRKKQDEENIKLKELLKQRKIEIDQLMSKNNTFIQLIKTIDENISQIYQKEVKILVKNI